MLHKKTNDEVLKHIYNNSSIMRYIKFVIGSFMIAIAYNLFLAPNNLVAGGISGLAIIFHQLFNFDNAYTILIGNLILLILSFYLLGKEKTTNSILGAIVIPIFIKLTDNIGNIIIIDNSQILVSAIFGGVVTGLGAGMLFKAGYTSGGTDILNQILSKFFKISIGKSMLYSDGLIVISSAFIFGLTKLLYAMMILYIVSLISDRVILGVSDSKTFYIVTSEEEKIKEYILKFLNHGVTVFKAKGGYKDKNKTVLMCVLPTKDYYRLTEGIHEIDEEAFFVVTDAYEVFGGE